MPLLSLYLLPDSGVFTGRTSCKIHCVLWGLCVCLEVGGGWKKGDRENFLFSLWGIMNMNVDWCSFLPRLTVVKAPVINRRQRQEELKGLKKRKEERKKKRADVVSRQLPLLFCQNHHGHVVGQTICCLCCCLCFYHISTPVHVCLYSLTSEG